MALDETTYELVSGPSKWDLAVSLFDGEPNHRHFVVFLTKYGEQFFVALSSLERLDRHGKSFKFTGHSRGIMSMARYRPKAQEVSGVFYVTSRQGTMTVRDQPE